MTKRIYIAATGGGAGAQSKIWNVPGCSSYFVGSVFPYNTEQLVSYIGYEPTKFVHPDVAIEMAMQSYANAWSKVGDECVGIGCTAAVATNRLRKGDYVAYVASCNSDGVMLITVHLESGEGEKTRIEHGSIVDDEIINSINSSFGRFKPVDVTSSAIHLLLNRPYFSSDGKRLKEEAFTSQVISPATDSAEKVCRILFPGAFNPAHDGHKAIAKKTQAVFNIEINPPHKGQLSVAEILQRLKGLRHHDTILTSGCPLYVDKSDRFNNHPIVMGADAFLRMLDPKWGPEPKALLNRFSQNGTKIMVFGREINGKWVSADEAISRVPESASCYDLVPISGRWDISSTQLRNTK